MPLTLRLVNPAMMTDAIAISIRTDQPRDFINIDLWRNYLERRSAEVRPEVKYVCGEAIAFAVGARLVMIALADRFEHVEPVLANVRATGGYGSVMLILVGPVRQRAEVQTFINARLTQSGMPLISVPMPRAENDYGKMMMLSWRSEPEGRTPLERFVYDVEVNIIAAVILDFLRGLPNLF